MQLEVGTPPINWWFSARFDCQRVNTHNFLVSFGAGHLFIQNLILQYLLHFITILGRLIIYYHIYYIPFLYNKKLPWMVYHKCGFILYHYMLQTISRHLYKCYRAFDPQAPVPLYFDRHLTRSGPSWGVRWGTIPEKWMFSWVFMGF